MKRVQLPESELLENEIMKLEEKRYTCSEDELEKIERELCHKKRRLEKITREIYS